MDFVKNLTGGGNNNNNNENQPQATGSEQKSEGGFLGGIGDKLNNAAGGGAEGEKKEDGLDKGESLPQSPNIRIVMFLTCSNHRHRLRPGELPWPGQAGQRERRRAGQGRADLGLHPWPVQGPDWQGLPHCGQIDWRWKDMEPLCLLSQGSV